MDSSGWVEYFTEGPLADVYARALEPRHGILSSPIVMFEVYRRIKREQGEPQALLAVSQIRKAHVEPVNETVALTAADLAGKHGLAMADALVYATARLHDATFVTSDADFAQLPGVEYHPKS